MKPLRIALVLGIAAAFAAAVLGAERHAALAIGLAPIAWIALEAAWRVFDAHR